MSLRWRLVLVVAAVACAVAAVVGVLVHQFSYAREMSHARQTALVQLDRAVSVFSRTGSVRGTGGALDDPGVPPRLRELVREGHRGTETGQDKSGPGMWGARPAGDRMLSVRVDMTASEHDIKSLDTSTALAVALSVVAALPVVVVIADRMSRRLRTAAGTARKIADGDLDARIAAPRRSRDEISEISHAVDSMAAALQARLLSEQRFTADVAHELRTPLMGLVVSAELLPPGEESARVRERARVLNSLVEELLEISRLDSGVERADVSRCRIGAVVEESVRRTEVPVEMAREGAAVARTAAGDEVETDCRRLDRIVANLVVNAQRHGAPPVEVTVDGRTVTVRDHGPGYPEALLEAGPQRFRSGTPERGRGHGLGLTIALGQAQVIGATLTFANAPDGGALATLRLPAHPPRD
ncbi:HAMP domain-containing sensor histidine kinase [Streptomyces sp. ODS28]|uniref:sensor histidine kinase n=1 Tax=Streptomyces sp. ODS28 TaxID=3136688 RepID=UPI0031EDBA32